MSVNFVPSLQQFAVVKVAVAVYTNHEVMEFEKKLRLTKRAFFNADFKTWEPFMRQKVSSLPLPTAFRERVLTLMMPLSFEYWMWRYNHDEFCNNDLYSNHIVWNSFGMIDRFKTAERLIRCQDFTTHQRDTLAYCYGRRDNVLEWKEDISFGGKFVSHSSIDSCYAELCPEPLYSLSVEMNRHKNMRRLSKGLACFLKSDDLLQKLTSLEDLKLLIRRIKRNRRICNNERICLFNLDIIQQEEFFMREPLLILKVLLQWPLQTQFLEVADRLWAHLKEDDFVEILNTILCKIKRGWRDFDYMDLLVNFWLQSPSHFQKYAINSPYFPYFRKDVFKIRLKIYLRKIFIKEKINCTFSYPKCFSCCVEEQDRKAGF
ncbi:uncharacterized protein TNCT_392401 [Trichonephila clavata]|uniref:Uncharacterized protein n=1 Tax=Trichonephila clavata TaxID=2740835 RepID=A0A8X6KY27_TRICU|nr:uncharacterized protein TNCT_392401 [Trichonephila clavata]